MTRRRVCFRMHPILLQRAEDRAVLEDRTVISVIEQAVGELLHVPLVNVKFPEGPVEMCAQCRAGVMWHSRCPVCGWRGREERQHKLARATN